MKPKGVYPKWSSQLRSKLFSIFFLQSASLSYRWQLVSIDWQGSVKQVAEKTGEGQVPDREQAKNRQVRTKKQYSEPSLLSPSLSLWIFDRDYLQALQLIILCNSFHIIWHIMIFILKTCYTIGLYVHDSISIKR